MSRFVIRGRIVDRDEVADILVTDGRIERIGERIEEESVVGGEDMLITPGLIDLHTHIREPGGRETVATATDSAKAGGFSTICMMPNTDPPIDNINILRWIKRRIEADAKVEVLVIPAITLGMGQYELCEIEGFAKMGVFALSDDGNPVLDPNLLRDAMVEAERHNLLLILHAEKDGEEARLIEERIRLSEETGCRVHIAHITTKDGVDLVREAKRQRMPVSTEATPHHFTLTRDDAGFSVKPPLRSRRDRDAVLEGLYDGTIDIIATDHAPHTEEEKRRGAPGAVGLETAVSLVFTELIEKGVLSERSAIEKLTKAPARLIGRECEIAEGEKANLLVIDPDKEWVVHPSSFRSTGRNTPFAGKILRGKPLYLIREKMVDIL
jgi:dihydroorotase